MLQAGTVHGKSPFQGWGCTRGALSRLPHLLPSCPKNPYWCGICPVENSGILNSRGSQAHLIPATSSHQPLDTSKPPGHHIQAKKPLQPLPQREKLGMLPGPEPGEVPVLEMQRPSSTSTAPVTALGGTGVFPMPWVPLPEQLGLSQTGHRWDSVSHCALCSPPQLLPPFPNLWKRQKDTALPRCRHRGLAKALSRVLPGTDARLGCP